MAEEGSSLSVSQEAGRGNRKGPRPPQRCEALSHALPQLTLPSAIPWARAPQSAHLWECLTDTPERSLANPSVPQASHSDSQEESSQQI